MRWLMEGPTRGSVGAVPLWALGCERVYVNGIRYTFGSVHTKTPYARRAALADCPVCPAPAAASPQPRPLENIYKLLV